MRNLEMLMDMQNTGGMSVPSSNTRWLAFSYLITKETIQDFVFSAVSTQTFFVAAVVKDGVLCFLHPMMCKDVLFY